MMNKHRLLFELDKVAGRYRLLWFWRLLAAAWLVAAVLGGCLLAAKLGLAVQVPAAVPVLVVGAIVLLGVGACLSTLTARNTLWVARQIEVAFPELRACLITAVEQHPDLPDGRYGYLQSSVIHQALAHADRHEWRNVVPTGRIAAAAAANLAGLAAFVAVLAGIAFTAVSPSSAAAVLESLRPFGGTAGFAVKVEPGDTEVERGTSLLVLARITGQMPAEAALVMQPEGGEEGRLAMSASLEDPVFGGRIPVVDQPLSYFIDLGDQKTPTYRVKVFEYPRLEKADARLEFPSYTGQADRVVQDVRTLSVVEGTKVTLSCFLNKTVKSALLVEDKSAAIELVQDDQADKPTYTTTIECDRTRRLKLQLVDQEGRENAKIATFTINVLPNQPVQLKPVFPARDLEVSALEELEVKATAWDDFGVKRYGLSYSLSGQEPVDVVLGEQAAAKQKHDLAHTIRLEELKAQPDDLLSYHFWAEDFSPSGEVRRAESDMYFAEVRPFEEIFRQGEAPPGGQQQQQQQQSPNAQQAQQLGELQKQIINATWKVIRREITRNLTAPFASDVEQIQLSQGSALEQAVALSEKLQDPESQEHAEAVIRAMQEAIKQLTSAHDQPSATPLTPALKSEQAAYQALLKLRAREHNVVRQNQRQRGAAGGQRSQQQRQQMQQLDLKDEENRYETQRQAQDQQESAEQRENRQVLNRLRELAQRQHDLNERLKELQTAMEEAKTPEQKEELKRQLQRLQEEERQVLQDTEELQSRLETPENLERMSQEREQLQQTREQVQRAAEALEEEKVSLAAASGTRAEQNFEELRDEFRRRQSGRFSEEVLQMRETARKLEQKEQELSQRLSEAAQPQDKGSQKSLRDSGEREKVAEELAEQRQRLSGLTEQMRKTIEDSEPTEPLLAERLYDAARKAQDQDIDRALEVTERALRSGLAREAQQIEKAAADAISELREGIDKAAEAVLGDETEALRRAREELKSLANELDREIQQNDPLRQRGGERGQESGDTSQEPGNQQRQEGVDPLGEAQKSGQKGQRPGEQQKGTQRGKGTPGEQPGEQSPMPGDGQESADASEEQGQKGKGGEKAGQQKGGQKGEGNQKGGQKGQGQQKGGQQPGGQRGEGQQKGGQKGGQQAGGQQPGGQQQSGQRGPRQGQRLAGNDPRGSVGPFEDFTPTDLMNPLTGERFREWSDRLRDVEEMVADPELRAEAARIRERARSMRAEFKRHSADPNWELVQSQLAGPLFELRDRVAAELLRRTAKQAILPLDRDPVPPKYAEKTRLYYERLGGVKNQPAAP